MLTNGIPESVQGPVVDNLFGFTTSEADIQKVLTWLRAGSILNDDGTTIFKLSSSHKRGILQVFSKRGKFPAKDMPALIDEVLGEDKSDLAKNTRLVCAAAVPEAANKEKVWNDLLDPQSSLSSKQRQAMMSGFYSWDQIDLIRPYFSRFYEILPQLALDHGNLYVERFFFAMLPRLEIEDSHIVALLNIKAQVPDTNSVFMNMLQDGIELLIRQKNIRTKAAGGAKM